MSTFSEKLRMSRIARGMSQEDVAQKLGTTKQVVSHYERGERIPKVDVAARFAQLLDVPVKYLTSDFYDFRIWEAEDMLEDYWNASPNDRLHLVAQRGIDPRIASDYEHAFALSQAQRSSPPSNDDEDFLQAIHDSPGMRIMFSTSKNRSEEDIRQAAAIIEAFYRSKDGEVK